MQTISHVLFTVDENLGEVGIERKKKKDIWARVYRAKGRTTFRKVIGSEWDEYEEI